MDITATYTDMLDGAIFLISPKYNFFVAYSDCPYCFGRGYIPKSSAAYWFDPYRECQECGKRYRNSDARWPAMRDAWDTANTLRYTYNNLFTDTAKARKLMTKGGDVWKGKDAQLDALRTQIYAQYVTEATRIREQLIEQYPDCVGTIKANIRTIERYLA